MPDPLLPINTILSRLAEYPQRIHAVTADLSEAKLHTHPAPDEWSANDVLAHVRACADVWGSYIARILSEDRPAIKAVSPRRYIDQTDYLEQEFKPSLQAFTAQRAKLLEVLQALAPEGWERQAIVTGVGKPIVRTVHTYSDRLTRHEREHVHQIEQIVEALRS
ncbi:MAG: DinB family protein [Chloroflexi bacterium]|nr:DinB family protein [Chloroflexota bacterium]